MSPRGQAFAAGALLGGATFLAWFYLFVKSKSRDFERIGQDSAPAIAEQAVKDYIATKFGATPERMRVGMQRIQQVTAIVSMLQAPASSATRQR